MDILPYLKSHHDAIRAASAQLAEVGDLKERRTLLDVLARATNVYLTLERDFLFPEVAGLFVGSENLLSVLQANASAVDKRLKTLVRLAAKGAIEPTGFGVKLADFRTALTTHFEQEEQSLMPKMRLLIRTEDREDLGQVFADAEADVLADVELDPEVQESPVVGRKRA